jgi:hypothetical protein
MSYVDAKATYSQPLISSGAAGSTPTYSPDGIVTATAVPVVAPSYVSYVIPDEPQKQKYCGGACCAVCCAIFLILLFLVPRPPRTYLNSTTVTIYPGSSISVVQEIQVYNGNFYSLKLSGLDGTVVTQFPVDGSEVTGYAEFLNGDDQVTDSLIIPRATTSNINLQYIFTNNTSALAAATAQECINGGAYFSTQGNVDMKTWSSNFHSVSYGE